MIIESLSWTNFSIWVISIAKSLRISFNSFMSVARLVLELVRSFENGLMSSEGMIARIDRDESYEAKDIVSSWWVDRSFARICFLRQKLFQTEHIQFEWYTSLTIRSNFKLYCDSFSVSFRVFSRSSTVDSKFDFSILNALYWFLMLSFSAKAF